MSDGVGGGRGGDEVGADEAAGKATAATATTNCRSNGIIQQNSNAPADESTCSPGAFPAVSSTAGGSGATAGPGAGLSQGHLRQYQAKMQREGSSKSPTVDLPEWTFKHHSTSALNVKMPATGAVGAFPQASGETAANRRLNNDPSRTTMRDLNNGPRQCSCQQVAQRQDSPRSDPLPWSFSVLCSCCCNKTLRAARVRHQRALLERDLARKQCTVATARHCQLQELQFRSQRLRDGLKERKTQCSAMAVEVAGLAMKNEERRARLTTQPALYRDQLVRLDEALCQRSMKQAIESAREQVQILRFQWALKVFAMHRLDVRQEDANVDAHTSQPRRNDGRLRQAHGVGKCGGLPLPHAGPELYGVLPCQELQSCLRLVVSITKIVATCLGIILPHPILLKPSSSFQQVDLVDTVASSVGLDRDDFESASALLALLEMPVNEGLQSPYHPRPASAVSPSMDPVLVSQRIFHATTAILLEADPSVANGGSKSGSKSSQYALAADVMNQDEFAIALQLLQNNIVALCIRAGVPVASLWPAEAVLLNLHALQVFCEQQIKQHCS